MSDMGKYRTLAKIARSIAALVDDGFTYDEAVTIILLRRDYTRFREGEIADAYTLFLKRKQLGAN